MNVDLSPGFDPRNKVVSFRLSDGEYAMAQEFCKASGYRGMSMLARSAFLAYMPAKADSDFQDDPVILQAELKSLHMELAKLIASLSKIRQHLSPESLASESLSPESLSPESMVAEPPAANGNYMEASGSSLS